MKVKVKISSEKIGSVFAEIIDEKNPKTAKAILDSLPLELRANRWGEEVYSEPSSVEVEEENSQTVMEVGDIAYWPSGRAICIFFGPTPSSRGDVPEAASGVNLIGYIIGDAKIFNNVRGGDQLRIERE